ncbi:MAG: BTAD domain-containing putative transcriptional regulator [Actinomycetota bacterium]
MHEVDEGAVAANLPPRSETEIPAPPPDMPALYCLGPLQVACGGRLRPKGWWKKSRELLAYLVAHPEGASKDRIMEELWPEEDPQRVQNLFATAMSLIRRQVRTTKDFRKYILKVEDSWRLEEGAWWADAFEFSRLVSEAERVDDSVVSVVKLRRALTLYRGDFCDDVYYPWAEPVRERFRNLFIRACARLAEMLLDAGEHEEALEVLDRAIAADPICEDLWRRAMSAEASMGRRAAALDRYKKLKQILSTELDVEPDPETESLALQISSSELQAHRHHAVHGPESPLHPAAATVR